MTAPDLDELRRLLDGTDAAARLVLSRDWARHLLARAEAADRLEAGVRALADDITVRDDVTGTWVDLGRVAALLDPAQPTAPADGADVGRRA